MSKHASDLESSIVKMLPFIRSTKQVIDEIKDITSPFDASSLRGFKIPIHNIKDMVQSQEATHHDQRPSHSLAQRQCAPGCHPVRSRLSLYHTVNHAKLATSRPKTTRFKHKIYTNFPAVLSSATIHPAIVGHVYWRLPDGYLW
jgi:hypothetical protein